MAESPWWEREKRWRFAKLGLTETEATDIWARLRPVVAERLGPDAEELAHSISAYCEPVGPDKERSTSSGPTQRLLFE
jgi:hypothetical protein